MFSRSHRIARKSSRNRRGFTLIELMIVIAIIGVLAAIAVPNFRAAREKANIKACWANQKTVAGALEMYNLDQSQSATLSEEVVRKLVEGGYLQTMPTDPGYGGTWTYDPVEGGFGITCKNHGAIKGNGTATGGTTPPPAGT